MTCCTGPTRCVGCEVDGIPLAGADWIDDAWMVAMAPVRPIAAPRATKREPWNKGIRHHSETVLTARGHTVRIRSDGLRLTVRRGTPPVPA